MLDTSQAAEDWSEEDNVFLSFCDWRWKRESFNPHAQCRRRKETRELQGSPMSFRRRWGYCHPCTRLIRSPCWEGARWQRHLYTRLNRPTWWAEITTEPSIIIRNGNPNHASKLPSFTQPFTNNCALQSTCAATEQVDLVWLYCICIIQFFC